MKRTFPLALVLLTLLLAACGSTQAPGPQLDLNDQFWFGTITTSGVAIPAGVGFLQTDASVTGILGLSDPSGNVITSPPMQGSLRGYDLSISFTDGVGDTGTIQGAFDGPQGRFNGTLTLVIGGVSTPYALTLAYQGPLGTQLQTQNVSTLRALAERLESTQR